MSRHIVRSAFINKVQGAKFYPAAAKGDEAKPREVKVGDRVTGPGEFESPDKDQIERLTAARCLVPSDADSKAAARAEATRAKATAARTKATDARAEATRLQGEANKAAEADKAAATKAATAADKKATGLEADAARLEAEASGGQS